MRQWVVLSVFVASAYADVTQVGWSYGEQAIIVPFGNSLKISWFGYHNLVEFADEADYDACGTVSHDFDAAGNGGAVDISRPSGGGTSYYACTIGSHCENDMKVTVTWAGEGDESPPTEPPTTSPPTADESAPTEPPTTSPPTADESCADDAGWASTKKASRDCVWVAKKAKKKCKLKEKDASGKSALACCPEACDVCGLARDEDADSSAWHYKKNPSKDCAWVAKKTKNCKKTYTNDAKVKVPAAIACPVTCAPHNEDKGIMSC